MLAYIWAISNKVLANVGSFVNGARVYYGCLIKIISGLFF